MRKLTEKEVLLIQGGMNWFNVLEGGYDLVELGER